MAVNIRSYQSETNQPIKRNPDSDRPLSFYFFPDSYVLAHVSRLTEIAKILKKRGHHITFCGQASNQPRSKMYFALRQGFDHILTEEPHFPYYWDRFIQHGWKTTVWDVLNHQNCGARVDDILEDQARILVRDKPDMVIASGTISVTAAAYIAGVPASIVQNAYLAKLLELGSPLRPIVKLYDRFHLTPLKAPIFRKYGLKPELGLDLIMGVPVLSPDLPEIDDTAFDLGEVYQIGPIHCEDFGDLPEWYDELTDGTPNIYITMGSTGLLDHVLRRCYGSLAQMPYRFVVTTAGQVSDETQRMAPSNFRFVEYAPGCEILKHCQALIYHGGTGTMYQGLQAGVPMIALHTHIEQKTCAQHPKKYKYGMRLSARKITGRRLAAAIDRVLENPRYRRAAEEYAPLVAAADGALRAADILEEKARAGAGKNLRAKVA